MANLDSAMDSAFWDQTISTPQALEGYAKSVPGEPFPLDGAQASKTLRIQQLSLLRNDLGSFSLHTLLLKPSASDWYFHNPTFSLSWTSLLFENFRPKKLISAIKTELQNADELELSVFRDAANHFLDKSLGLLELVLHMRICNDNLIQKQGTNDDIALEESRKKYCWSIFQWELSYYDITLDAAWPKLFMDHKGKYWEVPESISLDMSSLPSNSGCHIVFTCTKIAVFSYEKKMDFWRRKETKEDFIVKTDNGSFWQLSYDTHLKEPHATISGIIGMFRKDSASAGESQKEGNGPTTNKKESPLNMDLFSSLYGDLTRVDAHLDICSLPSFSKRVVKSCWFSADSSLSSPRLNLIFQQQVVGPIVCRIDLKLLLDSKLGKRGLHIEDLIYSLSYSFRLLRSGKVVAWFSLKRKEGMIELWLFEF
ncbi:hypothetical protein ES332_A08G067400v1 [Gossypium tomentosum]|uniref:Uncharacterized protein n=1 Tax=Gossypium tomentosum TaxID=34277 RepID=A0A5D2PB03_GOSTO|nr:hypothetical protein ES332_A08G067400v1 [Gossypium tomentosum]